MKRALVASSLLLAPMMAFAIPDTNEETQARFSPCGKEGSLRERILHCRSMNDGRPTEVSVDGVKVSWKLVASQADAKGRAKEVWLEVESNLLWGPRLENELPYDTAMTACEGWEVGAYLPTADEYMAANERSLRTVLTDFNERRYWTSTPSSFATAAYFFNGTEGYVDDGYRAARHSVRCVAPAN